MGLFAKVVSNFNLTHSRQKYLSYGKPVIDGTSVMKELMTLTILGKWSITDA